MHTNETPVPRKASKVASHETIFGDVDPIRSARAELRVLRPAASVVADVKARFVGRDGAVEHPPIVASGLADCRYLFLSAVGVENSNDCVLGPSASRPVAEEIKATALPNRDDPKDETTFERDALEKTEAGGIEDPHLLSRAGCAGGKDEQPAAVAAQREEAS
jgi:hypothetical protein